MNSDGVQQPSADTPPDSRFSSEPKLAVIALIIGAVLLLNPALPSVFAHTPLWRLQDAMHGPFFAVLTMAVYRLLRLRWSRVFLLRTLAVLLSLFLALIMEEAQELTGRSGTFRDFLFGACGVFGALIWMIAVGRWKIRVIGIILTLVPFIWPLDEYMKQRQAGSMLPSLATFRDERLIDLWWPQGDSVLMSASDGSLIVTTQAGDYEGVSFWPQRMSWDGFSWLEVEIYNPVEPFELGVRIDDTQSTDGGNRYSTGVEVPEGISSFRVEFGELLKERPMMDLKRIRRLALYTGEDEPGRTFMIRDVHLGNPTL